MTTKAYQIEGVWPTVRDDDWCGEWKILPRRPAVAPSQPAAVAIGASVTTLVTAAAVRPDDFADDPVLPAVAEFALPATEQALAMAAD